MGNIAALWPTMDWEMTSGERRLLIWKSIALTACIIGTAMYLTPVEPYYDAKFFGILVPAFLTGYIIIHVSEIYGLCMRQEYVFLEVCFAAIGILVNGICGFYQLYKWIVWIVDNFFDDDSELGMQELILALCCIVHTIFLAAVLLHRYLEYRSRASGGAE